MAATNIQSFSGDVEVSSNLTVDTNTLHVDSVAGRVGIGKTNPAYAVDVNGTLNATSLYLDGTELQGSPWSSNNSNTYYTTGAVGVGTDFPKKDLEVVGTLRLSNAATVFDTDLFVSKSFTSNTVTIDLDYAAKLTAPDGSSSDYYGEFCAISNDGSYAIVGARDDDGPAESPISGAGAAYTYVRSGSSWSFQQKLTAPDAFASNYFGKGVTISGDGSYALVGAYAAGAGNGGGVYIFSRSGSTWTYQQKITAPDAAPDDFFGEGVSVSDDGTYAIVGAWGNDGPSSNAPRCGSIYFYSRSGSTWSYQQKIEAPSIVAEDYFGRQVSMSGDGSYAVTGAAARDNLGASAGAAYTYVRSGSTWSYQQTLYGPDTAANDFFGYGVSISGDGSYIGVGALFEPAPQTGSVYFFSRSGSTWTYQQKITAPDATATTRFSNFISLSSDGTKVIVGAYYGDSPQIGSAYIFSRSGSTWSYQKKLTAPDAADNDMFGKCVDMSGDGSYAIAGSWFDDDNGGNSGSAYIYGSSSTTTYSNIYKTVISSNVEIQGTLQLSNVETGGVADIVVTGDAGDELTYAAKLTVPDGVSNYDHGFGFPGAAISGDASYAIIGARLGDPPGTTNGGFAYIFSRSGSTWTYQQNITAPDVASDYYFGYSVAISDDGSYAIGASYNINGATGAAYIFSRSGSTWTYQQKLTAPDAGPGDGFSRGTAISGDGSYAIFGAWFDDDNGGNSGSAYIYVRSGSTWTYQQKFTAPDVAGSDLFGASVSISSDGSTVLVGSYQEETTPSNTNRGAAYIFSRSGSTWSYQQKIEAPDGAASDFFGRRVSISGDGSYALVGAFGDDDNGSESGSAYIFSRSGSTWTYQQKITAPDGAGSDRFGYHSISISSDGSKIIVGSYLDDDDGDNSGSAYIFSRSGSTWTYQSKITAPDAAANDRFGTSTDMSSDGSHVLVSSRYADSGAGASYIFSAAEAATLTINTPIKADGTLLSFTGQHICFPEGPMSQGLVVSANKNKYVTLNGPLTAGARAIKSSESLPVVSLSNVVSDRSAFGVIDHFENGGTSRIQTSGATVVRSDKELGDNRVIVNSLGEGAMWVTNTNGPLESGDYITTSNIAGYGQRQDDDTLHSYTVAKITMDCDFEPEDVPICAIKKDENGQNVLDNYGRIQWEEVPDQTEKAYRVRYLTTNGGSTDEANAVWKAAYVGCTYHCG